MAENDRCRCTAQGGGVYDAACPLHAGEQERLATTQQTEKEPKPCGAWGGCTLPAGHNQGKADIPENHRPVTEKDRNCGGCRGEGSHRRWCRAKVGLSASIYGPMSEELKRMGDRVGPNNMPLTNRLYLLSAEMREWALTLVNPPESEVIE